MGRDGSADPAEAGPRPGTGPARLWAVAYALAAFAVLALIDLAVPDGDLGRPAAVAGAGAGLLLLAALTALCRRSGAEMRRSAGWQRRAAEAERHRDEERARAGRVMSGLEAAAGYLASVQVPAALGGLAVPASPSAGGVAEAAELCDRVAAAVADGAAGLRARLDAQAESYRLAVVMLARRAQASAHWIQEEAMRMTGRHADPDVLGSAIIMDHAAAQQARHAQSVAVLCGERPGQQWRWPQDLLDVVRAAAGRVVAYQRVEWAGEAGVAVAADAAESLIHLVAELLANATQCSPPSSQVLVTVRAQRGGAVIEVADDGTGLEQHRLEQAREIVSGRRLLGLGDLGEVPHTGMAVIGQYARRHGLGVNLLPAPDGGMLAVVQVPAEMISARGPAGA